VGSALELRVDFIGDDLHRLAQLSRGAALTRPLLSAQIYNGATRCDAATVADDTGSSALTHETPQGI
jgi:hypothetical protein